MKKKLFKKTPPVNALILGEHFNVIRTTMLEVRYFQKKKTVHVPTYVSKKRVDIEQAWPGCKELFSQTVGFLNDVAYRFDQKPMIMLPNSTFADALDTFIDALDVVTFGVADALGTGDFSQNELKEIDEQIMLIQTSVNRISKYVMEDFDYPSAPTRPPAS